MCKVLSNHTILYRTKAFDKEDITKNKGSKKALESKKGKEGSGQIFIDIKIGPNSTIREVECLLMVVVYIVILNRKIHKIISIICKFNIMEFIIFFNCF